VLVKDEEGGLVDLPKDFKMVFEGKLDDPKTSIPKIQAVIDAGLQPVITAVHRQPEKALENTFRRFYEEGRGASIETMASIQGKTPDGLESIYKHFGNAVQLTIHDYRNPANPTLIKGWDNLNILRSEGNYETIKQKLSHAVESAVKNGKINEDCYLQAIGKAPKTIDRSMDVTNTSARQKNEPRRELPSTGGKIAVLSDEKKAN
jgi:hypothetical protein